MKRAWIMRVQVALITGIIMFPLMLNASTEGHGHPQAEEMSHGEAVPEEGSHGRIQDQGEDYGYRPEQSHSEEHALRESHPVPAGEGHPGAVPLIYLFYWGILILLMIIILIYFVYRVKRLQKGPLLPLAAFLVLFAVSIYILEISAPAFVGKFDPESLRITHPFHESPDLGFLRFIYKFLLGIFLTIFAFFNLDRDNFKSTKKTED